MSVVGIDFGSHFCTIAAAQKRGIDILTNEVSSRTTPTMASFGEKERSLGEAALTQYQRNIANTVTEIKVLIGRKFYEKEVQEVIKNSPFKIVELPNSEIGIEVMYAGEKKIFSATAVTAMILQKLKEISEKGLGRAVQDCVISIPGFWTDSQRRAFLDAARIAGLNPLRLLHDNTATALQHGIYKTDLPEKDPIRVLIVDMGAVSTQVSVVEYLKGQLKVVGYAFDRTLGGRDIDEVLTNHFAKEFKDKYKIDVFTNRKALIRTRVAAEKLKKMLNTVPEAPMNIDSLMNDIDVKGVMKRSEFDELIKPMIDRLIVPIKQALEESGTTPDKLASIETSGSATRLLAVQNGISEYLKREVSKTTNQEESVARGCALQCAILSPLFKVREFAVTDVYPFPVKLSWKDLGAAAGNENDSVEVFARNNPLPSPKMVNFSRDKAFEVTEEYSRPELLPAGSSAVIGKFTIPSIPQKDAKSNIKVKVKLDINGIIQVESAQLVETLPENAETVEQSTADQKMDEAKPADAATEGHKTDEAAKTPEDAAKNAESKDGEPKKKKVKRTDLTIQSSTSSLSEKELNALAEEEGKMISSDRLAVETADRKNAVESYVYNIRGKLHESLSQFTTENDRNVLSKLLDDTENWLYEDGADSTKSVYVKKLDELRALGEPIVRRHYEHENRYEALNAIRSAIEGFKLTATSMDPKYDHIEQEERNKVIKECEALDTWLHQQMAKQDQTPNHVDPVVTIADLQRKRADLEKFSNTILNKPKPKPKPVEPKPEEKKPEEKPADPNAAKTEEKTAEGQPKEMPAEGKAPNAEQMDLD
eukprot:TRINITY_DN2129_c0_g2_i2.p1 TRINITY_DN2129_c0_g2~~TRINITY_DN2129_c0_g2_i2.p1  ORF type:complete len:821 (+),score=298.84 TRINITY_DN2129_c0_g2_i2:123-2585(+)